MTPRLSWTGTSPQDTSIFVELTFKVVTWCGGADGTGHRDTFSETRIKHCTIAHTSISIIIRVDVSIGISISISKGERDLRSCEVKQVKCEFSLYPLTDMNVAISKPESLLSCKI